MFDNKAFMRAKFRPRTKDVPVPELSEFFPGINKTTWTVRGLVANELARARDAKTKNQNVVALATALVQGNSEEKVRELKAALGYGDNVHHDVAYRIELLSMGSVEPECPTDLAVRVAERFPVTFWELSSAVLELTGQGQENAAKKPAPSGKTQRFVPAST